MLKHYHYCIVLMGWTLLPDALRPFRDLLCSPEFRYYYDVNMPSNFAQKPIFQA